MSEKGCAVLSQLGSRRWWWVTLSVLAAMALMVRLGLWQLDRMQERRSENQLAAARWRLPVATLDSDPLPLDPAELFFRRVELQGDFDYSRQVALRGQQLNDRLGIRLVAPLRLSNGQAVLVDRGWLPYAESAVESWPQFDAGQATVQGMVRPSQPHSPRLAADLPASSRDWAFLDVAAIGRQLPYPLLPFYVQQLPEPGRDAGALPLREEPYLELTAGTHLSYAVQWFSFALLLGVGHLLLMRRVAQRQHSRANPVPAPRMTP